jgi:hypothetical protein
MIKLTAKMSAEQYYEIGMWLSTAVFAYNRGRLCRYRCDFKRLSGKRYDTYGKGKQTSIRILYSVLRMKLFSAMGGVAATAC